MQGTKEESDKLTRRQEAALIAMIEGSSLSFSDIAKKISVNPSTLWRWRTRDENFIRRYRELRRGLVEHGIARMQGLMDAAIDCLERGLTSGNRPSEARCAVSIIRQSLEGVDTLDFDLRIAAVEKRLNSSRQK